MYINFTTEQNRTSSIDSDLMEVNFWKTRNLDILKFGANITESNSNLLTL